MFLRNIGPFELLILLLILVLIFGPGRVGELGGSVGKAIRNFRKEVSPASEEAGEESTDEE